MRASGLDQALEHGLVHLHGVHTAQLLDPLFFEVVLVVGHHVSAALAERLGAGRHDLLDLVEHGGVGGGVGFSGGHGAGAPQVADVLVFALFVLFLEHGEGFCFLVVLFGYVGGGLGGGGFAHGLDGFGVVGFQRVEAGARAFAPLVLALELGVEELLQAHGVGVGAVPHQLLGGVEQEDALLVLAHERFKLGVFFVELRLFELHGHVVGPVGVQAVDHFAQGCSAALHAFAAGAGAEVLEVGHGVRVFGAELHEHVFGQRGVGFPAVGEEYGVYLLGGPAVERFGERFEVVLALDAVDHGLFGQLAALVALHPVGEGAAQHVERLHGAAAKAADDVVADAGFCGAGDRAVDGQVERRVFKRFLVAVDAKEAQVPAFAGGGLVGGEARAGVFPGDAFVHQSVVDAVGPRLGGGVFGFVLGFAEQDLGHLHLAPGRAEGVDAQEVVSVVGAQGAEHLSGLAVVSGVFEGEVAVGQHGGHEAEVAAVFFGGLVFGAVDGQLFEGGAAVQHVLPLHHALVRAQGVGGGGVGRAGDEEVADVHVLLHVAVGLIDEFFGHLLVDEVGVGQLAAVAFELLAQGFHGVELHVAGAVHLQLEPGVQVQVFAQRRFGEVGLVLVCFAVDIGELRYAHRLVVYGEQYRVVGLRMQETGNAQQQNRQFQAYCLHSFGFNCLLFIFRRRKNSKLRVKTGG